MKMQTEHVDFQKQYLLFSYKGVDIPYLIIFYVSEQCKIKYLIKQIAKERKNFENSLLA